MTPRNWPPYAPGASCPKCGSRPCRSSWREMGSRASPQLNVFERGQGDWIQRSCTNCFYEWPEEPLDHVQDVESS